MKEKESKEIDIDLRNVQGMSSLPIDVKPTCVEEIFLRFSSRIFTVYPTNTHSLFS